MSEDDVATAGSVSGAVPRYGGPMADLVDHWGLLLTYGLITVGLGVILAVWPDETLKVVAILIGIQLIITGVFRLVLAIASSSLDTSSRALVGLFGALALVVGLLCLRSPMQTIMVIGIILGVWWLAAGLIDVVGAIRDEGSTRRGWDLAMGAITAVLGLFLLINPEVSLGVLVVVICVWLFAYGFMAIVAAFVLRGAGRRTSATTTAAP
jgi:uncharacterized membrane protein HdeD (DUF308 family)